MTRFAMSLVAAVACGALCVSLPVRASAPSDSPAQTFEYKIKHAQYGEIGTYINTVARNGERTRVTSQMRIAVKLLGVPVYRREADREEHWHGDRLVHFASVENRNGERIEVRGEARDDAFVITSPAGAVVAPASVRPSNPWSAWILSANVMMSTSTGRVFHARVFGGQDDVVEIGGRLERLRRFEIHSDKREFVWLDRNDVPVAFRTEDDGASIDFVLHRYPTGEAALWPATPPPVGNAPATWPTQFAEGER